MCLPGKRLHGCSPVAEAGLVYVGAELALLGGPGVGAAQKLRGWKGGRLWALVAEGRLRCRDGRLVSSTHTLRDGPEMLGGSKTSQLRPGAGARWAAVARPLPPRTVLGKVRPSWGNTQEWVAWGRGRRPGLQGCGGTGARPGLCLLQLAGESLPSLSLISLSNEELGLWRL